MDEHDGVTRHFTDFVRERAPITSQLVRLLSEKPYSIIGLSVAMFGYDAPETRRRVRCAIHRQNATHSAGSYRIQSYVSDAQTLRLRLYRLVPTEQGKGE